MKALPLTALLISLIGSSLITCADTQSFTSYGDGGSVHDDSGFAPQPCKAGGDADSDGIKDEVEGCGPPPLDTDNDKFPDYLDTDSDNDGVPDGIEGTQDPDGDGRPNFQDQDSDGDGIKDGDEDLNADGLFGCCLATCGEQRKDCPPVKPDECGPGQTCNAGQCQPPRHFLCSDGETDPAKPVTYPGGQPDTALPTFICRTSQEISGQGLKPIDFRKSSVGDWTVAVEQGSNYGEIVIQDAEAQQAGAAFDYSGPNQVVAGFVVSRAAGSIDLNLQVAQVVADIESNLPGVGSVSLASSGSGTTSHDKFPTVVSTQVAIQTSSAVTAGSVRNSLLSAILGKTVTQAGADGYGPPTGDFVLRFQSLLRTDGRLVIIGGVAPTAMVNDPNQATGYHLDDISNGTGLATAADSDTVECDPFVLDRNPVADIIWVVDESGSMSDNLQDIVNNANDFFSRAKKSGLDFRMGVTHVADPTSFNPFQTNVIPGKFCGQLMPPGTLDFGDGGPDRFLGPNEQSIFKSCVANPPYKEGSSEYSLVNAYEAVIRHLPRQASDETKIRPNASLAIIVATDELPKELQGGVYKGVTGPLLSGQPCPLDATLQSQLDGYLSLWTTLFSGNNSTFGEDGRAMVHLIGGLCTQTCAETAHGLLDLVKTTGGIAADICQKQLGSTLQIMIDTITGAASPAVLQYVPVSASLAVAIGQQQLKRSRVQGFDYVGFSNSLVFVGMSNTTGSQVVASYRRWVKQAQIE